MKLYLISQDTNLVDDTYDAAVVAAKSIAEARTIRPDLEKWNENKECFRWVNKQQDVKVKFLGRAKKGTKKGIILASYNAG
jgi:hypothetical protein